MDNGQFKRPSLCKVLNVISFVKNRTTGSLLSAFDGTTSFVSYMVYLNQFDMVFIEKTRDRADGGGDKHFFEGRYIP